jgi:hypothetical protein
LDQSGRTISVVITVLSVTASDVALLRPGTVAFGELSDELDDIAEVVVPRGV